jgi:hypothetical protein
VDFSRVLRNAIDQAMFASRTGLGSFHRFERALIGRHSVIIAPKHNHLLRLCTITPLAP